MRGRERRERGGACKGEEGEDGGPRWQDCKGEREVGSEGV